MTDIAIDSEVSTKIFNTEKSTYEKTPIFFGEQPGFYDSINRVHPELWKIYKTLKTLDWDEIEFDFSTCNTEFKTCSRDIYDAMIKTIAWQWEADTVASRCFVPIMAPFVTSSEVWTGYGRIMDNENLHALTYSEIVRLSFDDPSDVFKEIAKVKEAHERMRVVGSVFSKLYELSHKYALGQIPYSQELYEYVILGLIANYALERIQFMASFAVTFSICNTGLFQPIGMAVQKIAQDEYEIHAKFGQEILKVELATERGKKALENLKPTIISLLDEIVSSELTWLETILPDGKQLPGGTLQTFQNWTRFVAYPVYYLLGLENQSQHTLVQKNPLSFMNEWIRISDTQRSPQEQDSNQYKVGIVNQVLSSKTYQFDRPSNSKILGK